MLKLRVEQFCDDLGVKVPSRSSVASSGKEWYQSVFPNSFKNESKNDYFADIICGLTVGEALTLLIRTCRGYSDCGYSGYRDCNRKVLQRFYPPTTSYGSWNVIRFL